MSQSTFHKAHAIDDYLEGTIQMQNIKGKEAENTVKTAV